MLLMRKCACCDKEFIPGKEHLYRLILQGKKLWFCSYTCWRKMGGDNKRKRRSVQGY